MKISFSLNVDELVLLSMKANEQSTQYKSTIHRKACLLIFVFATMALALYISSMGLLMPLTVIVTALILLPFYPTLQRRAFRRHFRRWYNAPENKIYMEKQTLTFNKKGIEGESSGIKTFYSWPSVLKLFENENNFIILLEGHRAWLIPKKAFKKDALAEFRKWFKTTETIREDW